MRILLDEDLPRRLCALLVGHEAMTVAQRGWAGTKNGRLLTLEEAAFNLGASRAAVFTTITLPYLRPALIGAAAIAFLISFENFNTTLMLVGSDSPLTVMMYGRMREGASPVLNAVSLFLMVASALLALTLLRRSDRAIGSS